MTKQIIFQSIFLFCSIIPGLLINHFPVNALSKEEYEERLQTIRESSFPTRFEINFNEAIREFVEQNNARREYFREQEPFSPFIGQVFYDPFDPTNSSSLPDPLPNEPLPIIPTVIVEPPPGPAGFEYEWGPIRLRFGIYEGPDPNTSFYRPVNNFDIGFVEYFLFDGNPNDPNNFVSIGTSSEQQSNFSLVFEPNPNSFEPIIRAIPFDSSGNPIFISGLNNENIAESQVLIVQNVISTVPEPNSTLSLFTLATLSVASGIKHKNKQKSTEKKTIKLG